MPRHDCLYAPDAPIRKLLIEAAELDVRRYFRPPGEIVLNGREVHVSELDWLVQFHQRTFCPHRLKRFLWMYRLHRCGSWDYHKLVDKSRLWTQALPDFNFDVLRSRIVELKSCDEQQKDQISAASKLSVFTSPRSQVFIWDSNTRRAIDHHCPLGRRPRRNGYTKWELREFCHNAPQCLAEELDRADFVRALNAVIPLLNPVREDVFGRDDAAIRDFAARRLLDKLMLYEGRLLDSKVLKEIRNDPCGEDAQKTVRKWIKGLRNDIEAADEAHRRPDAAD